MRQRCALPVSSSGLHGQAGAAHSEHVERVMQARLQPAHPPLTCCRKAVHADLGKPLLLKGRNALRPHLAAHFCPSTGVRSMTSIHASGAEQMGRLKVSWIR